MKNQNLKGTILGVAIAALAGAAFAQSPATPATDRGATAKEKSSGDIIDRQTQPPARAGSSTAGSSDAKSGKGSGASQRSSGEFIERQTKPSPATGASSGEPSSRTSGVTSGRIIDEQTKPGAGRMDPAQRGGTTR